MNLLLWILIGVIISVIIFWILVKHLFQNPHIPHSTTPAEKNIPFSEVRFPTRNQRSLYGWWVPSQKENAHTYIIIHGWGRNIERMMDFIVHLHPLGCNLLVFDARNHGNSDKDNHASMLKFAEDISAAIDFVVEKPGVSKSRLGVIGHSIGGSASIYAAAHDERIEKVVAIGAFANPASMMRITLKQSYIPFYPLGWLIFKFVEKKIGARLDDIAPSNNIAKTSAQILLIHGTDDKIVPLEQAQKNYSLADHHRVELWTIEGKGHSDCHTDDGFWKKLSGFICN